MGFAIYKGVGRSWGEVCNKGLVVHKGVRKGTIFEAKFWLFKKWGRMVPQRQHASNHNAHQRVTTVVPTKG